MIYNSVSGNILNAGSYGICDFQMSISKNAIDYKRNGEQTAIFQWSGLFIREPTEVAVASGIAGIIEEMVAGFFLYLYKHTSDQLAAFRASLESTQRLLLANSICEKLEGEVEQTTRAELIRLMVNSAVQLTTVSKG